VVADGGVPLGLLGVVADDKPLRPHAVVAVTDPAGGDGDLLDPHVPGDGAVSASPGERGGGLGVGVAEFLGVDVVPAAAGQVRPVRRRGEPPLINEHPPESWRHGL
jgi:hypothetical protein